MDVKQMWIKKELEGILKTKKASRKKSARSNFIC